MVSEVSNNSPQFKNILTFYIGAPVDAIVEFGSFIVIGCYDYNSERKTRTGKILFLEKRSKNNILEIKTSGTFSLSVDDSYLYAANSNDISVFDESGNLIEKIETESINTYIYTGKYIFTCNTNGEVQVFQKDLNSIKEYKFFKISNDSLWVVKEIDDLVYVGSESGQAYTIDLKTEKINEFGGKREGIIDIVKIANKIVVSSYDGYIEIYKSKEKIKSIKTGSLWKIIESKNLIVGAAMYDGLKIFDTEFNLKKTIPTKSICYGLCVIDEEIFWSSFYDNCVYKITIDKSYKIRSNKT